MKHAIEGKTEGRIDVTEGQGRRHKQLLDDLQETKGYGKFKEEALDRNSITFRKQENTENSKRKH